LLLLGLGVIWALISDFDVGWWVPGTWLNYTRTFPIEF